MTKPSKPSPTRYRVQRWNVIGSVHQVMPWAVMCPPRSYRLPIMARCYTRSSARRICRLLNAAEKGKGTDR